MNIVLFDLRETWDNLLPLTFTRPASELRVGIRTIREKWEAATGLSSSISSADYLSKKYPVNQDENSIWIAGNIIPGTGLVDAVLKLKSGQRLLAGEQVVAFNPSGEVRTGLLEQDKIFTMAPEETRWEAPLTRIQYAWDIFSLNGKQLSFDFTELTKDRESANWTQDTRVIGEENIFIEEGAKLSCATINATEGPVYIGRNAEIMEGAVIRGSLALCENSAIKLGAKIYGPTTIGPFCKVAGEVNNVVFQGFSNKAHEGFLGNAVIGEWCNLGAGTNNSNLKNTYQEVRMWNYHQKSFIPTGLQFCGLVMGDHSKTGINTMLNTGTTVGVSVNLFGSGFPRNYIPSYSWGGAHGLKGFSLSKAIDVARAVMERRGIALDETEEAILRHIYQATDSFR